MKHYMLLIFFIAIFTLNNIAQPTLSNIFTENMVLQQQSSVAIWGWSENGKKISVNTSWNNKQYETKTDNYGKWKVFVETGEAGGPYEITISNGKSVLLKNVMLGEVWLCSGQSNMEMPMKGFPGQHVMGSNEVIAKSKNSNIRLITVSNNSSTTPKDNFKGSWKEATPETVSQFSASAYYFGKLLNKVLDVPVGLIEVSWGGSCIQAWMSKNTAVAFEDMQVPYEGDIIKVLNRTPTVLFNGMVNPIVGYGIKGCVWYQGETNYQEPERYKWLLATMVNEWRSLWDQGDFPFYYVQIAPFDYKPLTPDNHKPKFNSAFIREAQLQAMDTIPNSGMVCLLDVGEQNNIHPKNKKVVGDRLAYWALGDTYGIKGIGYKSPSYRSMEVKDSSIIIGFNQTNGITSFGKEVTNFEIAGKDKVFYPAKVTVRYKSVIVSSPEVPNPVAVRYGFKDFVVGDLFGTDGLPVSSFRTDDWGF